MHIRKLIFVPFLALLMAFASLSTDVYLPAMPQMQKDLGGNIELTITGFLIGYALMQLFWGSISDKFGRKLPLFIGLAIFALGNIGCASSSNISEIFSWRIIQAIGASVGPVVARAMTRDVMGQQKAAAFLSTLMVIMSVMFIAGPFIGGLIILFLPWQAIFWLLAIFCAVMFLLTFLMPETLSAKHRNNLSLTGAFKAYGKLCLQWNYMRYTLALMFFYIGAYAFVSASSQVYIVDFGIKPQFYGFFFGLNILAIILFSFINKRLVRKLSLKLLVLLACTDALIGSLALSIFAYLQLSIVLSIIALFIYYCANGVLAADSTALAIGNVAKNIAASASALMGCLQYASGIFSSIILAYTGSSLLSMALIIMISALLAFLCVLTIDLS